MKIQKAIDLIKSFEGLKLEAYLCSAGVPTIGYGTTIYPNGVKVKIGDKISSTEAFAFISHDVSKFSKQLDSTLSEDIELNDNQYAAVLSLVYNIGITNFKSSTLLKLINNGHHENRPQEVADEFLKWNKAAGKVMHGLSNRRKKERDVFLGIV